MDEGFVSNEVEHIAAVQDNPFIRNFGIENVMQHRQEIKDLDLKEKEKEECTVDNVNDQEQEYHVNSGFVNKLRSKFAELENRSSNVISLRRRSASVENLLNLTQSSSSQERLRRGSACSRSSADDSKIKSISELTKVELRKKQAPLSNRSSTERPKSSETKSDKPPYIKPPIVPKNKNIDFSQPNNIIRSVKPPVAKRNTTQLLEKQSSVSSPTKIEHHDWKVAPDLVKVATDNIVIIETTQPTSPSQKETSVLPEESSNFRHPKPFKDKTKEENRRENELPKPNTVSAFLSMFEKGRQKPVRPVQAWRKNLSPTRKSSGSDSSTPHTASPNVTPRSPLTKRLDDNVFTYAQTKTENEKTFSKDTKDTSFEEVAHKSNLFDLQNNTDSNYSSSDQNNTKTETNLLDNANRLTLERTKSPEHELEVVQGDVSGQSSSVQSRTSPVSPLSLVFDSSSIAPLPKPVKQKHEKKHKVPKDTLALKHDHDRVKSPEAESQPVILPAKEMKKTDFIEKNAVSNVNNENISLESNIKPSQRKAKISPRKTKIFDSSNMVKANRDPPKIPSRNLKQIPKEGVNKPKDVSLEVKDRENKMETSVSNSKPPRMSQNLRKETKNAFDKVSNNGVTKVNNSLNTTKSYSFPKDLVNDTSKSIGPEKTSKNLVNSTEERPVTGVSSFVANRLKKSQEQSNGQTKTALHLVNGSSPSPIPRKRPAPEIPTNSVPNEIEMVESEPPPLPSTPEPSLPKTNIDDIISRRNKTTKPMPKMVFDSSKIANKRKDPPKRKPPRKTLEEINKNHTQGVVPKLDLTSITNDTNETEYQEGYIPTIIKPCPYKFIGGDVILEKSPYKKSKKGKIQVRKELCSKVHHGSK